MMLPPYMLLKNLNSLQNILAVKMYRGAMPDIFIMTGSELTFVVWSSAFVSCLCCTVIG